MAKKGTPKNGTGGPLDTLKKVYAFMTQNGLDAVEISEESAQIKLVRRKTVPVQVPVAVATSAGIPAGASVADRVSSSTGTAAPAVTTAPIPGGIAIKSPMMGIFYRAPSPSSPPFCKEGDQVKPGHVICMIEAMKVFNEIKAEYPCTIARCLVENGKPVKAGQDLIIVQR